MYSGWPEVSGPTAVIGTAYRLRACWTGDTAREDAIGYATARAKFGRGEIRVLNNDNSIERAIPFDQTAQL